LAIYWTKYKKFINKRDKMTFMKVDTKDVEIVRVLQRNSRASIRDIAKAARLRPSTVHQRIVRMKKNGVIERFTVKLNDEAMSEDFAAFILVTTKKDFEESVFADEHVKEVCGVTGEYDLLFKLKFRDVSEFNTFLLKFRKSPCIEKTLTMVVTTKIKEDA